MIVFFYAVGADGGEKAQAPTAFWDMLPVYTGERVYVLYCRKR